MKKVISFSIWGNNPIYSTGILENISLTPRIYPGWDIRVYVDNTVPQEYVNKIRNAGGEIVFIDSMSTSIKENSWAGLFWRFYPASDQNIDVFIVRDADSRINSREKAAVDRWVNNNKYTFHSMRDHWNHNVPIMGGMWGAKRNAYPQMTRKIKEWLQYEHKGTDQIFLKEVWKSVRKATMVHDRHCDGFFRTNLGEMILPKDVSYYNEYDNCGDEKDYDFPRGKVSLNDGRVFQRLDLYHYDPIKLFGRQNIFPFPSHPPIDNGCGRYVGESSQDYWKTYNLDTDSYAEDANA